MPISIDIIDFKCFNQLRNGVNFDQNLSEFTPNLVGNIGEKVMVSFSANITQTAFAQGAEEWQFTELVDNVEIEVERSSGSFIDDSVQVGDTFRYFNVWSTRKQPGNNGAANCTVDFISTDGKRMKFTVNSLIPPATGFISDTVSNVGMMFDQRDAANLNTAIFAKFGLISNEETFNFLSKTTENQQVYYRGEIPLGTPGSLVAESLGSIKDWVSGEFRVRLDADDPDFFSAQYDIEHEFIINPFYILAFREFIDTNTIPELLAGDNSLKYAVELELRKTLTNTGSSKSAIFQNLLGFTGWYGENFNGLNKKYQVVSTSYEDTATGDPLEGINISLPTTATIVVEEIGGSITDYSCGVYLIKVPTSEDDYIGTETDIVENFLFKSTIVSSPDTSSGNVTTSLISGNLVIEYEIDYTVAERLRLTTQDEFLLLVQVEDPTISAGNSDRVMLIADLVNYTDVDFLAEFINVDLYNFLSHGQNTEDSTGGATRILSNEDGILLNAAFGANVARNVIMNSIKLNLVAYNAAENKSFNLDTYDLNIEGTLQSGVQLIEIDTTRGYPLPVGDEFNLVRLETGNQVGDYRQYFLLFGQKIRWQDWILNPEADSVFFNSAEPNNNLNFKSSNYSGLEGYEIRLALVVNVTGEDDLGRIITGDFINYGGVLTVNDYDESEDVPAVTGVIQTFDLESGASLEGNILYNGKDTLFRAVFQNAGTMQYAIHRIEPSQNQGDGILELSSVFDPAPTNLLKPVAGETRLKFTDDGGGQVTTECIIDGDLIQEGVQYKLSARIGQIPIDLVDGFEFTIDTTQSGVSTNTQFQLPLVASGNYSFFVDKGNGDALIEINTWDDPATLLDYSGTGAGSYDVKLYGTIRGWAFANGGDGDKMTTITQWGTFQPTVAEVFRGCSNLNVTATDIIDLSQTTTLTSFFAGCSSLVFNTSLADWDVSLITDFTSVFNGCSLFNLSINAWDVSSGENFTSCFSNCEVFNQPLASWDMTSAIRIDFMFANCDVFNQPLNAWQLSSCTNAQLLFFNAAAFNQSLLDWPTYLTNLTVADGFFSGCNAYNQPLTGWDDVFDNVANCSKIFQNCFVFNQPVDFLNFTAATDWTEMFANARDFNQSLVSWNAFSGNITTFRLMFSGALDFDQNLAGWNIAALTTAFGMMNGATSFSTTNLDNLLNGWAAQVPTVQNNVDFDAQDTARSAASNAAVATLTGAPYNWTINTL